MYKQLINEIKSNKKVLLSVIGLGLLIFLGYVLLNIMNAKEEYYTSELNRIISNPETYNKKELLNLQEEAGTYLSLESQRLIESEIARMEQAEIAEAKKAEETKKVEAEKAAKAKRIEEGYMDFSGTAKEVAIEGLGKDEYDSFYIGPVQPFTSVRAPDGTLTVQLTLTKPKDVGKVVSGDVIRTITFAPNELKSSIYEVEFVELKSKERTEGYEYENQYEIINSTTIWNHWNNTHIKFSTPFTKP